MLYSEFNQLIKLIRSHYLPLMYEKKEIIKKKNADTKNVQPKPQKTAVLPSSAPETESE